jgi:hypothetical protein
MAFTVILRFLWVDDVNDWGALSRLKSFAGLRFAATDRCAGAAPAVTTEIAIGAIITAISPTIPAILTADPFRFCIITDPLVR